MTVQRQTWIWDIMNVLLMRVWIRIQMSPLEKFTGLYFKKSAVEIMAEELYR